MIVADKTNKINIFDISDILYIYGKYGSTIISAAKLDKSPEGASWDTL